MSSPRPSASSMMTFGVGDAAIGFDRGGDAAHLDLEMRLAEPPILAGRLDGGGGLDGLAERLDRDARRRRDMLVRAGGGDAARLLFGVLASVADHLPTSLILPLSASG